MNYVLDSQREFERLEKEDEMRVHETNMMLRLRQPDSLTHPQISLGSRLCVLLFQVVCL